MEINETTIIAKNQNNVEAQIGEELTMMSIDKGVYYTLNKIGSEIWKLVGEPIKIQHICEQLSVQYNIDENTCKKDVIIFIKKMLEQDLISIEKQ